jgi:hypothetical protein
VLGIAVLIWSLAPVYNMFLIALDSEEGEIEFDGNLWPPEPSLDSFRDVIMQEARYLEDFWHQFGNCLFIRLVTMVLTVLIGSVASFAVSRMRLRKGSLLTNAALITYVIPASFLIVPYFRIMHSYGLSDNLWAVIAAQVTLATPFAILLLQLYAKLIPLELDDSARVAGVRVPSLSPHLSASDDPGAGGRRDLCADARLERLFVSGRAARGQKHDCSSNAGTTVQRHRRRVERNDGRRDHLRTAAIVLLFTLRRHVAASLTTADVTQ